MRLYPYVWPILSVNPKKLRGKGDWKFESIWTRLGIFVKRLVGGGGGSLTDSHLISDNLYVCELVYVGYRPHNHA